MTFADPAIPGEMPCAGARAARVAWVDIAKGWCIILVVMMHSALGVGLALGETGWLHAIVAFAKPFRMPDFFLVAGLFARSAINLPWRAYLDRRFVHFIYFFALWFTIVLAVKSPELGIATPLEFVRAYAWGFVDPFSSLWFIQILPLFFLAVRLIRGVPLWVSVPFAIALHLAAAWVPTGDIFAMSSNLTGWITFDNFALFFVYFLVGVLACPRIFALARLADANRAAAIFALVIWAIAEAAAVRFGVPEIPGLTLAFGLAGACAVVALSALLAPTGLFGWLAYCGRHSLAVYLAFTLPMGVARIVLLKTGFVTGVGWMSLLVTLCAITIPLLAERIVRGTLLAFLFKRPAWARIAGSRENSPKQFHDNTVTRCQ